VKKEEHVDDYDDDDDIDYSYQEYLSEMDDSDY
jgi:hypothetical protein